MTKFVQRTEAHKDMRTSLESTHMCEEELARIHSFEQYANSKENEDRESVEDQKKKDVEFSDSDTITAKSKENKEQELNTSMGLQLNKLCLNEPQSEKRLTRSMSRKDMK